MIQFPSVECILLVFAHSLLSFNLLQNAVLKDMYVSGSTLFEGVATIENSDWSDTFLRKDQQKYLCNHPTAKGTNTQTGADTRESLMCKD